LLQRFRCMTYEVMALATATTTALRFVVQAESPFAWSDPTMLDSDQPQHQRFRNHRNAVEFRFNV
jgi:hypothetical protein